MLNSLIKSLGTILPTRALLFPGGLGMRMTAEVYTHTRSPTTREGQAPSCFTGWLRSNRPMALVADENCIHFLPPFSNGFTFFFLLSSCPSSLYPLIMTRATVCGASISIAGTKNVTYSVSLSLHDHLGVVLISRIREMPTCSGSHS